MTTNAPARVLESAKLEEPLSLRPAHASPRTYPSAEASRVLQRPTEESMPAAAQAADAASESVRFTPSARACDTDDADV